MRASEGSGLTPLFGLNEKTLPMLAYPVDVLFRKPLEQRQQLRTTAGHAVLKEIEDIM